MSIANALPNQPPLFSGMEAEGFDAAPSPAPVKSARSRNRAAWWQQDLSRTALYLMGQARTEDERAFVEQLYEQAVESSSSRAWSFILPILSILSTKTTDALITNCYVVEKIAII
jgi:hypothetical protein